MRLPCQILRHLGKLQISERTDRCFMTQVRCIHRPAKKLEEVTKKTPDCMEPCNIPRKSRWNIFGRNKKPQECIDKKVKPECETVEFVTEDQAEYDMQTISQMDGKVYRTCGTAYVLQKDTYPSPPESAENSEEQILEEMMKDPTLKGQCDPMPPFQSTEMRLIELSERRLHPLYKKLMSIPKRPKNKASPKASASTYKTRSGPVLPDEFPPHLKLNREMFEKKNILYEYKKAEPPQQMLARIVEMKNNQRPQLKGPEKEDPSEK